MDKLHLQNCHRLHYCLRVAAAAQTAHVFRHRDGHTIRIQIKDAYVVGAAEAARAHGLVGDGTGMPEFSPALPADGTDYYIDPVLFNGISQDDINQLIIANCWFLAYLAFLAGCANGQAKIKKRIIADPADPTLAIVYFTRAGVTIAVFVTYEVSTIAGKPGPSGSVWALIAAKAEAFFRNAAANTYHDEDYGTEGEAAVGWGDQIVNSPRNTAEARQMNAAGYGVFFSTPDNPGRADVVEDHDYFLRPAAEQPSDTSKAVGGSPWGKTGGMPVDAQVSDIDFALNGFGWAASSIPQAEDIPLPDSVQAKLAAANGTASATDGPPPLAPAVPDSPAMVYPAINVGYDPVILGVDGSFKSPYGFYSSTDQINWTKWTGLVVGGNIVRPGDSPVVTYWRIGLGGVYGPIVVQKATAPTDPVIPVTPPVTPADPLAAILALPDATLATVGMLRALVKLGVGA